MMMGKAERKKSDMIDMTARYQSPLAFRLSGNPLLTLHKSPGGKPHRTIGPVTTLRPSDFDLPCYL